MLLKTQLSGLVYVLGTVLFTVYGQVVLKWQMQRTDAMPVTVVGKAGFLVKLIASNGWLISGLTSAFLASLCWMVAVSKLDLSYAYPFMSFSFVCVLILSCLFFNEPLTGYKLCGLLLIVAGIIVGAQSR